MLIFAVAIFSAAFLVFQIQPIVARFLLPAFGGSPSVWTTCMLFFQVALFCGYAYTHWLTSRLNIRAQVQVHTCLLLISLVFLPVFPEIDAYTSESVSTQILLILLSCLGLPFLLISSTAPLLQVWFGLTETGRSPFRLYALSNAGSLIALLSYPFVVEPFLSTSSQVWVWSSLYVFFVLFSFACAWMAKRKADVFSGSFKSENVFEASSGVNPLNKVCWLLLSACGSVLLLSITNKVSQDVAVIPFLWVLPLSLYLCSFIICFEHDRWYQRWFWYPLLIVSVAGLVYLLNLDFSSKEWPLAYQVALYCAALFVCCMVCHGELVRCRPASRWLTSFYLYLSLGGALGGAFVGVVAPLIFNGYWELHLALTVLALIVGVCVWQVCARYHTMLAVFAGACCAGLLAAQSWFLFLNIQDYKSSVIAQERGFFGVVSVHERAKDKFEHIRTLYHGRINHGTQWLRPGREMEAATYYAKNTGVALAFRNHPNRALHNEPLRIGVIGLGTGTIATFGRVRDHMTFYEIDPNVESVARQYFSYLSRSQANIDVEIGDGRRSLQTAWAQRGSEQFDLLIVDAFSSDSIPIHLLTQEAAQLYWKHLKPDGLLVVHITNFHLDLSGVVRRMAQKTNKSIVFVHEQGDDYYSLLSDWVIMTSNADFLQHPEILKRQSKWRNPDRPLVDWTDSFSNLLSVVRWD